MCDRKLYVLVNAFKKNTIFEWINGMDYNYLDKEINVRRVNYQGNYFL